MNAWTLVKPWMESAQGSPGVSYTLRCRLDFFTALKLRRQMCKLPLMLLVRPGEITGNLYDVLLWVHKILRQSIPDFPGGITPFSGWCVLGVYEVIPGIW